MITNETYDYAQNFIRKFSFLLRFGFQINLEFHQSSDKNCNYALGEFYVTLVNLEKNYKTAVFFPIERIKRGECDFWSYDFDGSSQYPGKSCEYTYQEAILVLWSLFG